MLIKPVSMTQIWRSLWGGVREVSECSGRPKIGFATWPVIMLIIYYWQNVFLLLNWAIERVVNLNMTRLYICLLLFDFVDSHARCCCCSIVFLRFHVTQIKHVDCKMSTNKNYFQENISWYFWTTAHTTM